MPKFKPKFKIGDTITVSTTVRAEVRRDNIRKIHVHIGMRSFQAIVTGYGFLREGHVISDYECGSYFVPDGITVRVVKFRRYMLAKEEYTTEADCSLVQVSDDDKMPYGRPRSQFEKDEIARDMQDHPEFYRRNEKGQFIGCASKLPPAKAGSLRRQELMTKREMSNERLCKKINLRRQEEAVARRSRQCSQSR